MLAGADELGIAGPRLNYSTNEIKAILARYNGFGPDAQDYGEEVKGIYDIFEAHNAARR